MTAVPRTLVFEDDSADFRLDVLVIGDLTTISASRECELILGVDTLQVLEGAHVTLMGDLEFVWLNYETAD